MAVLGLSRSGGPPPDQILDPPLLYTSTLPNQYAAEYTTTLLTVRNGVYCEINYKSAILEDIIINLNQFTHNCSKGNMAASNDLLKM